MPARLIARGVVDADVDAAEALDGLRDRGRRPAPRRGCRRRSAAPGRRPPRSARPRCRRCPRAWGAARRSWRSARRWRRRARRAARSPGRCRGCAPEMNRVLPGEAHAAEHAARGPGTTAGPPLTRATAPRMQQLPVTTAASCSARRCRSARCRAACRCRRAACRRCRPGGRSCAAPADPSSWGAATPGLSTGRRPSTTVRIWLTHSVLSTAPALCPVRQALLLEQADRVLAQPAAVERVLAARAS